MVRAGLLGQRGDSLSNKCAIGDGEQRGFVRDPAVGAFDSRDRLPRIDVNELIA